MIKKSGMEFYREDEIMSVKYLLVQAVVQMKEIPLLASVKQRKGENKVRVTVDNLINIICEVDKGRSERQTTDHLLCSTAITYSSTG